MTVRGTIESYIELDFEKPHGGEKLFVFSRDSDAARTLFENKEWKADLVTIYGTVLSVHHLRSFPFGPKLDGRLYCSPMTLKMPNEAAFRLGVAVFTHHVPFRRLRFDMLRT